MSKINILAAAVALTAAGCVPPPEGPASVVPAPGPSANQTVGGAVMDPARTIAQNTANSRDHRTLVAAVRAAQIDATLSGTGPVTLFAPTDAAFARLPATTVETLMHPSNKALLGRLLGYHIVPGRKTRAQISADARASGGTASYRTAAGATIRVSMQGNRLVVRDVNNNRSEATQSDVLHSNGVLHVVNAVLLPPLD